MRDYESLSEAERRAFRDAVSKFIDDIGAGRGFRKGLRVKGVRGSAGVYEMTWAENGRATFQYGASLEGHAGEPHVIWRRIGTHVVFDAP